MRKTFFHTLLFLVCTGLFLLAVGWCFVPKSNRWLCGYKGGSVYALEPGELDVFVLGSSNAAQGVTPAQWWGSRGWTGHNYGEAFLDVYKAADVLARVLARQRPKVVLLETDMLFSVRHPENEGENLLSGMGENVFSLLRWHNRWKEIRSPRELFSPRDWTWRHNQKGFEMVVGSDAYTGGAYMLPHPTEGTALHPEQVLVLDAMLALCRARGCEVAFFSVPAPQGCNLNRSRAVEAYAAKKGVPFWDFNFCAEEIGIDWATDTPDQGAHLNLSGAEKVTAALENCLLRYGLPDHRNDPAFARWEQEYREYRGDVAYTLKNTNNN